MAQRIKINKKHTEMQQHYTKTIFVWFLGSEWYYDIQWHLALNGMFSSCKVIDLSRSQLLLYKTVVKCGRDSLVWS